MKRSPIKRKPPKDRRSPEEKAYWNWLATLPCVVTGQPATERHHPRSLKFGCGMGKKSPDWFAIPVIHRVHDDFHRLGPRLWRVRYGSHERFVQNLWDAYGRDNIPIEIRGMLDADAE